MPAPVLAPALPPGATVAVVSMSWQGIAVLPERTARAVAGVETGHAAPLLAVPIGIPGRIEGEDLIIEGPAVS